MRYKEDVTCSLCNLILDEPVSLPCFCIICNGHLTDCFTSNNEIKCISCNKFYQIPYDGFRTNKTTKKLLEDLVYLSDEEKNLKSSIQSNFSTFKSQNKTKIKVLKLKSQENLSKIKEKVELRKEQLKKQIDEISAEFIQNLKHKEVAMIKMIE